jgi:hypothetical protein
LVALPVAAFAQQAQDDDEDTLEQKIIKNILGGMGVDVGRPGIEYRERSPLVLPPTRDLPPPEASLVDRNPSWPKEQVRKKTATAPRVHVRAGAEDPGTSAAMTPDELRRGAKPTKSSRITDRSQTGSVDDPNIGRPLRPNELGNEKNILSWGNLWGYKPEQVPFPGEPDRSALTQPPPGYQTPSPNAPYGVGADAPAGWKIPTIISRPEGPVER